MPSPELFHLYTLQRLGIQQTWAIQGRKLWAKPQEDLSSLYPYLRGLKLTNSTLEVLNLADIFVLVDKTEMKAR
jgi:hypothetical protein